MTHVSIDSSAFRQLMRHVPAAVAIVATGPHGRRNGLTATSLCSLTDRPPMLLVCVNQRASAYNDILENGVFSVNLLAREQSDLAATFAGMTGLRGEERFRDRLWTQGVSGAPVLGPATCTFECRLVDTKVVSTHAALFADVLAGNVGATTDCLMYAQRGYGYFVPGVAAGAAT